MGLLDFLRRAFGGRRDEWRGEPRRAAGILTVEDLARRLGMTGGDLQDFRPRYRSFKIPKRSGGLRRIDAPEPELKALQRRILRRLLGRLRSHPAATGFERGRSIVENALPHAGRAVVVRMDLRDFFGSTPASRVGRYFRGIGWDREAAALLERLCTHRRALPQGAPTSPRLANLLNRRMDARLDGLARKLGARYTRYADDLTFSFGADDRRAVHAAVRLAKLIVAGEGYRLHEGKKLRIRRRHQRQVVTGLVVNDGVRLPRIVRRRLRAIEHRVAAQRPATLAPAQLAGWRAFRAMVEERAVR